MSAKKFVISLMMLCFCLALSSGVMARASQEEPSNSPDSDNQRAQKLEEVQVTATFPGSADEAMGQSMVPNEELERPMISGTVLEPLSQQSGLQVMGASTLGGKQAEVRLRGFDEWRYRVMLDGMPVQRDGSYGRGAMDWSLIAPEDIDSINIYRGSLPAKYGNSPGGLIEIVSQRPSGESKSQVSAQYGSLGTWSVSAANRWKAGPVGWALAARQYETDGYLRNNHADNFNFNGNLTFDLPWQMQAGVGLLYSKGTTGMPVYNRKDSPYYDSGKPDADQQELGGPGISSRLKQGVYAWGDDSEIKDTSSFLNAFVMKKFEGGHARLRGMLWNEETTESYYDAADSGKKIYERDTTPEDNNWQILGDVVYTLGAHTLEVGGETRTYGWGDQSVPYIDKSYFTGAISYFTFVSEGFEGQPNCLHYSALYVQDTWKPLNLLDVEFGLRGEWFDADEIDPAAFGFPATAAPTSMSESNLDPRLGVRLRPWEGGELGLRVGITHRYPNSPEYFWWYLNRGSGFFNTDLSPERAVQYELGFEQKFAQRASLAVRGYYYDISDYISSTTVSGVGTVVYNIDEVKIYGGELEGVLALPWNFSLWANLTLQKADKSGDPWDVDNQASNQLSNFPEVMANLGLDYHWGELFKAGLSMNYVGPRDYMDGTEATELGSYVLVNCYASYRFLNTSWGNWEALFSAANLLDQDYELEAGYPMPGLTVMGGLRFLF